MSACGCDFNYPYASEDCPHKARRMTTPSLPTPRPRSGVILAIDPGPMQSAFVIYCDGFVTIRDTLNNDAMLAYIRVNARSYDFIVIEKVESFGMAVGAEVFETVYWSGRFAEAAHPMPVDRIGRKAVKLHLCQSMRAKDANIRAALIDRYGGKEAAIGRKANPGPLYGIAGDVWSALAVAVTYSETHQEDSERVA